MLIKYTIKWKLFRFLFRISHGIYRLRNQRIFELQESKTYHIKALEKLYPRMIFLKTSTKVILSKNPKNSETVALNMVCKIQNFKK